MGFSFYKTRSLSYLRGSEPRLLSFNIEHLSLSYLRGSEPGSYEEKTIDTSLSYLRGSERIS